MFYIKKLPIVCVFAFVLMMLFFPNYCREGAKYGLLLCGRIIIPSLFPFTVCVLFMMRSNALTVLRFIEPVTQKLFGQSGDEFAVFVLSLLGGYPIGGKLITELYNDGKISKRRAQIMQCCCTNAGPAFIIIAIGNGIFGSQRLGIIILCATTLSAIILAVVCKFLYKNETIIQKGKAKKQVSVADNFVTSTADAATSVFGICGYVILFSTISAYLAKIIEILPYVRWIQYIMEITTAVTLTRNVYVITFLLGFSGFCVWMQLYSISGRVGVSLPYFAASRLLYGGMNVSFTFLLIKLFKPEIGTVSNGAQYTNAAIIGTPALTIALISMGLLLCISLFGKKRGGNILKDVI